ncbi:MAG: hypothetical protein AAGO57_05630 [Pseudomonadota bacterium]
MHEYKIPREHLNFVSNLGITFEGTVRVDYPEAQITVPASATLCKDYTYSVHLNPEKGIWSAHDDHKWTAANILVRLRATINQSNMKEVSVEVVDANGKVHWSDNFDLYGPYKERHVFAFAQPAFEKPISEMSDHTYGVGVDDAETRTYLWPCGGDHDGDGHRKIASGLAFQPECDCLSQRLSDPVTKGLSGIRYGVDGVCHQATNRLLCPACIEVNDAWAYKKKGAKNLTYTLYGRLGVKLESGRQKWEAIKDGCLTKTYSFCHEAATGLDYLSEIDGVASQDAALIDEKAVSMQSEFLDAYTRAQNGKLSAKEYSDLLNEKINNFVGELRGPLDDSTHSVLFDGLEPNHQLVDPRICATHFG